MSKTPDYKRYFKEYQKKRDADPILRARAEEVQKHFDSILKNKGTVGSPFYAEKILTEQYIADPQYSWLWGFCPTIQTTIKTNSQEIDIVGGAHYIDRDLAIDCGIRWESEDMISIEVKLVAKLSSFTEDQKDGMLNGKIYAVISFAGSASDVVDDTDCPVLYVERMTRKRFNCYHSDKGFSNPVERAILETALTYGLANFSERLQTTSQRCRYLERIRSAIDLNCMRSYENIILYLSSFFEFRCSLQGESLEDYRERVICKIDYLLDLKEEIPDLDNFTFDSMYEFQAKDGDSVPAQRITRRLERQKYGIFDVLAGKHDLFTFHTEEDVNNGDTIYCLFSDWLVQALGIKKKMFWRPAFTYFFHVHQVFLPQGFKSHNCSPALRFLAEEGKPNMDYYIAQRPQSKIRKGLNKLSQSIDRKKSRLDKLTEVSS